MKYVLLSAFLISGCTGTSKPKLMVGDCVYQHDNEDGLVRFWCENSRFKN